MLDPDWVGTNWPALRQLMRTVGVFLAWNLKDFPEHVVYGAITGDPSAAYSQTDAMRISLKIEGPKHVL